MRLCWRRRVVADAESRGAPGPPAASSPRRPAARGDSPQPGAAHSTPPVCAHDERGCTLSSQANTENTPLSQQCIMICYTRFRDHYTHFRDHYTHFRNHYTFQRSLHMLQRSLHTLQRSLHTFQRSLHTFQKSLNTFLR